MSYGRFFLMIATSTVVMFFLMYLNTYAFQHATFSETRMYMAVVMGTSMAFVMLIFMLDKHPSWGMNTTILISSLVIFGLSLFLVRSQTTVDDVSYMRAMIPHHSIAILTSERAKIIDPEVRALADGIIQTQLKEIDEMKRLIEKLENKNQP